MQQIHRIAAALMLFGVLFTGCDKSTDATDDSILYEDAAEAVSAGIGDNSGGATESFADVTIAAGGGSISSASPVIDAGDAVTAGAPVYDPTTGWWTVSVSRTFDGALMTRSITRTYQYQFQKNGVQQKDRINGSDTATALKFRIVSGTGTMKTARLSHTLTQLKGAWTTSDLNKDTVTITLDSAYVRGSIDTITTRNAVRTYNGTLTLTAVSVKAPRYRPLLATSWRAEFHHAVSGSITGNYTASITVQRGDLYKERSVNRDFTITLGDGEGSLNFKGGNRYGIDLHDGQRN